VGVDAEVEVAVIGAGVVGLAVARALALEGREVAVLETERQVLHPRVGIDGDVEPLAKPAHPCRERALTEDRSRSLICTPARAIRR